MRLDQIRKRLAGAVAGAVILVSGPALAGTDTDTFLVTATIQGTCTVVANDLAFGIYDPAALVDNDATTTIDVNCTTGTIWELGLSGGVTNGNVNARQMAFLSGAGPNLGYQLFSDAGRTANWEDIGGATVTGTGTGVVQAQTVYGRITALQASAAAAYQDTVTATVSF